MIYIVDARMGMGKSSAAFAYMREHQEKRYLYVTPNNEETKRPITECPELNFIAPDNERVHGNKKSVHLKELVGEGRNISMTHCLYKYIDSSTAECILAKQYTIIIDEVIDVLQKTDINRNAVNSAVELGVLQRIEDENGVARYELVEDDNHGFTELAKIINLSKTGRLAGFFDDGGKT